MLRSPHWILTGALVLLLSPVWGKPPAPSPKASAASAITQSASAPQESQLVEHGHYINRSGVTVRSPTHTVNGQAPAGASARCGDGTFSFSQNHRGTCSHHGGVAAWL